MDHEDTNATDGLPAAAASPRVKSPSYSPKLEDNEELKPDVQMQPDVQPQAGPKGEVVSSDDFRDLLTSLSSSVSSPVQSTYDNLLSLYQYTLGRLQLLELIGANGVLTDALILRLQQLSDENDRLLESERANRTGLADLKRQLDDQLAQTRTAEAALNDAHSLLQQQEQELEGQTRVTQELKEKLASEQKSRSRHSSDRTDEHRHSSRRSTHDDSKSRMETDRTSGDRDRHRSSEHRSSHRSDSHRQSERESHRSDRSRHRHERESSITSSRHFSSRKAEEPSRHERRHSRVDRIHEVEDEDLRAESSSSRRHSADHYPPEEAEDQLSERRISINCAAAKSTNGTNGASSTQAETTGTISALNPADEEEEYEPEIDLGEEEEEAPPVKPAPVAAPQSSRSHSRERDSHRDREHFSNYRTRSRFPARHRTHELDDTRRRSHDSSESRRKHHRDEDIDNEYRHEIKSRSPTRSRRDDSPPQGPKADSRDAKRTQRESSSSGTASKNRSTNMYGRLGLPLSGSGGNGQGAEGGGRASLAIRGAGRNGHRSTR